MAKTPTNFRLSEETINQLEYIAKELSLGGKESNKTEAIEVSVSEKADSIGYEKSNDQAQPPCA